MSKLKHVREQKGMSQAQLATEAEVSLRSYQNLEQGSRDINGAKLKTLLKICNALDCKLENVLDDEEIIQLLMIYTKRTDGYTKE